MASEEVQSEPKNPKLESVDEDDHESWRNDKLYAPDEHGYHDINPKQWKEYIDHLDKSGGYDVPNFPETTIFYGIHPCAYTSNAWVYREVKDGSVAAVKQHNDKEGTRFQYYWIVKVNEEPVAGVIYYITFLAEDLDRPFDFGSYIGDPEEIVVGPDGYHLVELQAKVFYPIPDEDENINMELLDVILKKNLSNEGLKEHRALLERKKALEIKKALENAEKIV